MELALVDAYISKYSITKANVPKVWTAFCSSWGSDLVTGIAFGSEAGTLSGTQ